MANLNVRSGTTSMTREEATKRYSALSPERQLRVLVRYARDVTVIARGTYVPMTEEVADPRRLRMLNEIQHRLLAQVHGLIGGAERFPDDAIVAIAVAWDDPELLKGFETALGPRDEVGGG